MPTYGLPSARAEASRRNGKKSRGPKTAQGKARSSQNALKHGLRAAKHMVLPDEDAAEFEALEAALIDELAPDGVLQTVLAKRIAAAAWRMSRAERIEVEIFAENALPSGGPGLSMIRDANRARAFETLVRYRGGTLAEFWRSLRTLKALQSEAPRRAEMATPQIQAEASNQAQATPVKEVHVLVPVPRPNEPELPQNAGDAARSERPAPEPDLEATPETAALSARQDVARPDEPKSHGIPVIDPCDPAGRVALDATHVSAPRAQRQAAPRERRGS